MVGLDGDPTILAIARRKAARAGVPVRFDDGMASALPYPDGSFDAVTSTLMLHHLTLDQRVRTLAEVRRVLRPDGRLVVADFAPPHNRWMTLARRAGRLLMRLHAGGKGRHGRHASGHLEQEHHMTLVGSLALVTATRPLDDRSEHVAAHKVAQP